jgi:hypothetical protein
MNSTRMRLSELRELDALLTALLQDSELIAELSLLQKEHIQGASTVLRSLFPIVDVRDAEDAMNES